MLYTVYQIKNWNISCKHEKIVIFREKLALYASKLKQFENFDLTKDNFRKQYFNVYNFIFKSIFFQNTNNYTN